MMHTTMPFSVGWVVVHPPVYEDSFTLCLAWFSPACPTKSGTLEPKWSVVQKPFRHQIERVLKNVHLSEMHYIQFTFAQNLNKFMNFCLVNHSGTTLYLKSPSLAPYSYRGKHKHFSRSLNKMIFPLIPRRTNCFLINFYSMAWMTTFLHRNHSVNSIVLRTSDMLRIIYVARCLPVLPVLSWFTPTF